MLDGVKPNRRWDGPDITAWEPWRPHELGQVLGTGPAAPWCVVGGWAIDIWLGRQTRPHGDIEIATPRGSFRDLRRTLERSLTLYVAGDDQTILLGKGNAFPVDRHQCWVSDAGKWRLDVMLEPGDRDTWVFRRDARVRESRDRMVDRLGDIPFLRPEGVLLYKAKACRSKDEADFRLALDHLDIDACRWLASALKSVHPGHHWLDRLQRVVAGA